MSNPNFFSDSSKQLFTLMIRKGYPEEFCKAVTRELHTDFTAGRMIKYLQYAPLLPLEEVADEMFAIISDRDAIVQKKQMEHAQQSINEIYNFGLGEED